jgi:hypothetical protein
MDIKVKRGNSKLGKDTIIINITSSTDCYSKRLGLCPIPDKCYAMNPEYRFPQILPYRRSQEVIWDNTTASEIAYQLISIQQGAYHKMRYLRFSECGDFKSQDDIDKMDVIAKMIKPYGLTTYGYTARLDLDYSNVQHVIVNGTGFMVSNTIRLVKEYDNTMALQCNGNCRNCKYCKTAGNKMIYFKIH